MCQFSLPRTVCWWTWSGNTARLTSDMWRTSWRRGTKRSLCSLVVIPGHYRCLCWNNLKLLTKLWNWVSILFHRVPGVTIATDVICGFPTETEEVSFLIFTITTSYFRALYWKFKNFCYKTKQLKCRGTVKSSFFNNECQFSRFVSHSIEHYWYGHKKNKPQIDQKTFIMGVWNIHVYGNMNFYQWKTCWNWMNNPQLEKHNTVEIVYAS